MGLARWMNKRGVPWSFVVDPIWPMVFIQRDPPDMMKVPKAKDWDAAGCFDRKTNAIWIRPSCNCWPVRAHEYGHWAFYRFSLLLDGLWEIPWWACGLRRLILGRRTPKTPKKGNT